MIALIKDLCYFWGFFPKPLQPTSVSGSPRCCCLLLLLLGEVLLKYEKLTRICFSHFPALDTKFTLAKWVLGALEAHFRLTTNPPSASHPYPHPWSGIHAATSTSTSTSTSMEQHPKYGAIQTARCATYVPYNVRIFILLLK